MGPTMNLSYAFPAWPEAGRWFATQRRPRRCESGENLVLGRDRIRLPDDLSADFFLNNGSDSERKWNRPGCNHTMTRPLPNDPDHLPPLMVVISFWTRFSIREGSGLSATAMRKSNSSVGMAKEMLGQGKCSSERLHDSSTLL